MGLILDFPLSGTIPGNDTGNLPEGCHIFFHLSRSNKVELGKLVKLDSLPPEQVAAYLDLAWQMWWDDGRIQNEVDGNGRISHPIIGVQPHRHSHFLLGMMDRQSPKVLYCGNGRFSLLACKLLTFSYKFIVLIATLVL